MRGGGGGGAGGDSVGAVGERFSNTGVSSIGFHFSLSTLVLVFHFCVEEISLSSIYMYMCICIELGGNGVVCEGS